MRQTLQIWANTIPEIKTNCWHIAAETKRTPFRRRHIQTLFFNENNRISIEISQKFVPKVPINNIPALVQIMAWRRPGDKPVSEPMMVCLLTHICVTRPQWVLIKPPQHKHYAPWAILWDTYCSTSRSSSEVKTQMGDLKISVLTHWGRDKIPAIFQTTFSKTFSWM